jgi:tetratricopeptide (TPR) repeat protein
MIVRDEAHVIRETLDAVAPHVDCFVIVDTGSRDLTIETIRSQMAGRGIAGKIYQRPWRDFGTNRTEALALAHGQAEYMWMIDADDLLVGTLDLRELSDDCYLLRYGHEFRYWRAQIFRDGLRWRYEGVVHEYATCLDPFTERRLEGSYHIEDRRLGARNRRPEKYLRDCEALQAVLERNPDDRRATFYLAQSCYDAGRYGQALEFYERRARMGGWEEEVFYSLLRAGACLQRLGEASRARERYLKAWRQRPVRAEPLYELARQYRTAGNFGLGYLFAKRACSISFPEQESLFVAADVYGWRAADELAICAYHTGRFDLSLRLTTQLLEDSWLPDSERPRVARNRELCAPWVDGQRGVYPVRVVESLCERRKLLDPGESEVTLTVTSCRRPELFERAVNSFLHHCAELERIGRWICVDTGSSGPDRARMRELYPFFEFVYLDPSTHTHGDAINVLLDAVASPLWLHLEDDWQFFRRGRYIERALEVMADDPTVAQVVFNRNYLETPDQQVFSGHTRRTAATGQRYHVHEPIEPGGCDWDHHVRVLPPDTATVAHWPNFTLRPSLMRTAAIRALGRLRSEAGREFEHEFARRYTAAGLRTAFFDTVVCLHIGRLTNQPAGEGRVSAFDLLDEPVA